MRRRGEHAVVLGASMAGLVTSRVVAEFYDTVTVVERDELPNDASDRRGVPQSRHLHGLLCGGLQSLETLFPGLLAELAAAGATVADEGDLSRVSLWTQGREFNRTGRFTDGPALTLCLAGRPMLEFHVRQRVCRIDNVKIVESHDFVDLLTDKPETVTGVRVVNRETGKESVLPADLVIDATGRGTRLPSFLDALGYGRPRLQQVKMKIGYASQRLRLPPNSVADKLTFVFPHPGSTKAGALQSNDGDAWILTLADAAGDQPPQDRSAMLALATDVFTAPVVAALRHAEPIGDVVTQHYHGPAWHRYDKMPRFPKGLLALGDSICSFNPIHGQGMAMSAFEAITLRECLSAGTDELAPRFFRKAAKLVDYVWRGNERLNLAQIERHGWRAAAERLTNWWLGKAAVAAQRDISVTETLLRVAHLVDLPGQINYPSLVRGVLANS